MILLINIKKDFTCYEKGENKLYLTQIYNLIPAELDSNNKRFNYTSLKKDYAHRLLLIALFG